MLVVIASRVVAGNQGLLRHRTKYLSFAYSRRNLNSHFAGVPCSEGNANEKNM
jgi:hypothetical protein